MNILKKVTWQAMWKNKTRTIVTIIGVALSAALFMAVTTASFSLWDFMVRGYEYESGDFFVTFDYSTDEQYAAAQADKTVKSVADLKILGYTNQYDRISPGSTYEIGAMGENFLTQMSIPLIQGRLPENSSEILISDLYISNCRAEKWEIPEIGDKLTFSVFFSYQPDKEPTQNANLSDASVDKEYTVVGIIKNRNYRPNSGNWGFPCMLTLADGNEGPTLWHRLFLETTPCNARIVSQSNYGEAALNTDLLGVYGFSRGENTTLMILLMCVILLLIVLFTSVSLIGNAFSISVAERTRQFGLLSSIGTTRKQIRASVRYEAFVLMMCGIPSGVFLGYGVIALVFHFYGEHLARLFSFSVNGGVSPYAVFSVVAVLIAVLACALTVWISTWIPSLRASRIAPLEAIRQNREYKNKTKSIRVSKLTAKIFGISGFIGAKYYKISRKKYRAIVVALTFSMVLFVFAAYFSDQLDMTADAQGAEDYDFSISSAGDDWREVYSQVRSSEAVTQSAISADMWMTGIVDTSVINDKYKEIQENDTFLKADYSGDWCSEQLTLYYLEDDTFIAHLESEGIDPAPYLAEGVMMGVTIPQTQGGWYAQNEAGEWVEMHFYGHALDKDAGTISCVPTSYPSQLGVSDADRVDSDGIIQPAKVSRSISKDGQIILTVDGKTYLEEITEEVIEGKNVINYYSYNKTTGEVNSDILHSTTGFAPQIEVSAQLEEVPFGVSTQHGGSITIILPLSKAPAEVLEAYTPHLCLNTNDYQTMLGELKTYGEGNLLFSFTDYNETQMNMRGIVKLLRVFSTGFVVLISLIACTNVLTTITTNVALRRKDYGMLRSMGFTQKHLYGMMVYECMNYGIKAILWSAPLSIGLCYGLYKVTNLAYSTDFAPPWDVFIIGICLILAVLFASATYAIFTIRKDNPIDAIRMENT